MTQDHIVQDLSRHRTDRPTDIGAADRVSPDAVRQAFSEAMSAMYRAEVPLYGDLIDIVRAVNDAKLAGDPALRQDMTRTGEIERMSDERHGAIRLGTAAELGAIRRVFAVMGMVPVGYYDLSVAGLPVHATAFRPVAPAALTANAFRVFVSLLRIDLIADADLRDQAEAIVSSRTILSEQALALLDRAELDGGLSTTDAGQFVREVIETFRWRQRAIVDSPTYQRLHDAHRLVADIVSFPGAHINHLTPRTLDIDAVQGEMIRRGIAAKAVIEGPPPRHVPILLRQTSFTALEESVLFEGEGAAEAGTHTARFGEIEQRGAALTRKGRALYDACLGRVTAAGPAGYADRLMAAFADFPDDEEALRAAGLVHVRYSLTDAGRDAARAGRAADQDIESWIAMGWVAAAPVVYEDFLPVSAAGIFRSNLHGIDGSATLAPGSREAFEGALGTAIIDPFAIYEAIEADSRNAVVAQMSGTCGMDADRG